MIIVLGASVQRNESSFKVAAMRGRAHGGSLLMKELWKRREEEEKKRIHEEPIACLEYGVHVDGP